MFLSDQVRIDLGTCQIEAEEADALINQSTKKIIELTLRDSVRLQLNDAQEVCAEYLHFDAEQCVATLKTEEGRCYLRGETAKSPFELRAHDIVVYLSNEATNRFRHVEAAGDVQIFLDNGLMIQTETVDHSNGQSLFCSECDITQNGNHIHALSLEYDTLANIVSLSGPTGEILTQTATEPLQFAANSLLWEIEEHSLTMTDEVHLAFANDTTLSAKDELVCTYDLANRTLEAFQTSGYTEIFHMRENGGATRFQSAEGLIYDPKTERISSCSEGLFANGFVHVRSDRSFLQLVNQLPESIRFEGLVEMESDNNYGLADSINYHLAQKELLLQAEKGKKVLFWSDEDSVQVSTDQVLIKSIPGQKRPGVYCDGDTSFFFDRRDKKRIMHGFNAQSQKIKENL